MSKGKINLKLLGRSLEDLKTISAYLQDSIVILNDVIFLEKNKIFILLVSRFMWEDAEKGLFRENKRIKCVLKFNQVSKVLSKNIDQKNKKKFLELLTIETVTMENQNFKINLIFAGDNVITIFVEEIDVLMDDLGDPWVVKKAPKHKI
tara:strand:- start:284 stop:730 length:447 start_codon:yes stop_codon:yes gene_type:complete